MEGVLAGIALGIVGTIAIVAFTVWIRRAAPEFEEVSITVATGEEPAQVIDRIAAALSDLENHSVSHSGDNELAIGRSYGPLAQEPAGGVAHSAADILDVTATELEVGTKVEITGRSEPHVVHRVLSAIAQSPPWMAGRRHTPERNMVSP